MIERVSMEEALKGGLFQKRSKYGNVKTEYAGRMYHSGKEAHYARQLDACMKAVHKSDRVISWEPQVKFSIVVNRHKICDYYLDFKVLYADGRTEYVDVKSEITKSDKTYRIKKKLMLAVHKIAIKEVI